MREHHDPMCADPTTCHCFDENTKWVAGASAMREAAAALCERVRCRVWSPEECALQIRLMPLPKEKP